MAKQEYETTPADIALLADAVFRLRAAGLRFWLSDGALLGLFREGCLIPWDMDIDFSVWADDVDEARLREIFPASDYRIDSLFSQGIKGIHAYPLNIDSPRMVDIICYAREGELAVYRSYFRYTPSVFLDRLAAFASECLRGEGCYLRVERRVETAFKQAAYQLGAALCQFAPLRAVVSGALAWWASRARKVPLAYECPVRFFDDLQERSFLGVGCPTPRDIEAYFAAVYGPDWRTPTHWKQWHEGATRRGEAAQ